MLLSHLAPQTFEVALNQGQPLIASVLELGIVLRVHVREALGWVKAHRVTFLLFLETLRVSRVPHHTVMYLVEVPDEVTLRLLSRGLDSLGQGRLIQEHHLSF